MSGADRPRMAAPRGPSQLGWVKALYVFVFASYATASAYLTLYFRRVGLTNGEIGVLLAVQPLVTLVSGPAWAMLADRFGLRSRLLTIVLALSIFPSLAMMWWTDYPALFALTVVGAIMAGPVAPLMDSIALKTLGAEREQYGAVRAYGSLGYAPVVWAVGALIEVQDIRWIFLLNAAFLLCAVLTTLRIRQETGGLPTSIGRGLGTLVRVPGWLEMMTVYFLAMVLQGIAYGFVNLYMDELGASESLMGVSQTISSLGQWAVLAYVMPRALRRWGSGRLMVASVACYALKLAIWVLAPNAIAVGASQLLTGVSFGSATVAIVDYAARKAPPGLEVTSQSLASGLIAGLGRAVGSAAGGEMYDGLGPRVTFTIFALLGTVVALGFATRWRRRPADVPPQRAPAPAGDAGPGLDRTRGTLRRARRGGG